MYLYDRNYMRSVLSLSSWGSRAEGRRNFFAYFRENNFPVIYSSTRVADSEWHSLRTL